MKVIDLLNRIANGEETHFDTKLNDKSVSVRYYNDRNFSSSTDPEMLTIADIIKSLNTEVEIIEEDKKIEKLEHWVDVKSWVKGNDLEKGLEEQSEFNKNIYYKINEIIDYLEKENK